MNAGVILFLIFAVCVLIGVPISMSLGIGSLAAVALGNLGVSPAVIAQRVFGGLQSTSIMAIAFFILAGNLMAGGGISRRIVNFANCLIGNIRGGMSVALVIACAFFAALSGSAPATVVAIGSMLYADMVKQGYPEDRTAGLLVIAGGLGPVIPPSIIMVLYCTLTGASVTNMFSQGMVIGILIMIVLILEALYFAHKEKWPKAETKHTAGEIGKIFLDSERHAVYVDNKPCELTYKEYELLKMLMLHAGIVTNRDDILNHVWGTDFQGESRTLDMHIKTLRQKLGEAGSMIKTVRNVGYILDSVIE